jgi:hypothetical protein
MTANRDKRAQSSGPKYRGRRTEICSCDVAPIYLPHPFASHDPILEEEDPQRRQGQGEGVIVLAVVGHGRCF